MGTPLKSIRLNVCLVMKREDLSHVYPVNLCFGTSGFPEVAVALARSQDGRGLPGKRASLWQMFSVQERFHFLDS